MALIDRVHDVVEGLSPEWKDLLRAHGLDLNDEVLDDTKKLEAALRKKLRVRRNIRGFEDFAIDRPRGIEPGHPAQSLLYHALASPSVFTTPGGEPELDIDMYPTLSDLDAIENYIFGLNRKNLQLDGAFVAVLAYQYRTGPRTPHLQHADMSYSRCGVARVGTKPANYQGFRRSFWPVPEDGEGVAVMPARYGVFLARSQKPVGAGAVQGGHQGANDDPYVFPFHKLFDGDECIDGRTINIQYLEYHLNEKLRRIHSDELQNDGGIPLDSFFDKDAFPFVRDSEGPVPLVHIEPAGASVLLTPVPHDTLVRTAGQTNTAVGEERIASFKVPRETRFRDRSTRFVTSLEIPSFDHPVFRQNVRLAPEYVNIRHRVDPLAGPGQDLQNLNEIVAEGFEDLIRDGDYFAAHFVDDSADGCIAARVTGLAESESDRPAYSLVTAPDFFPVADQFDLFEIASQIGKFAPLSIGRVAVNPHLKMPQPLTGRPFSDRELTLSAVVSSLPVPSSATVERRQTNVMTSYLPDAASDLFQPGWDVAVSRDDVGPFRTSFGLGSPYPEDAKLCAAISSFWPAVAPDASRTFGNPWPNFMPMLDVEVGFHPQHPRVQGGEVPTSPGWDGEYGPFFETIDGAEVVNFADISRSDYVENALAGTISVAKTAGVQSEELLSRMIALQRCRQEFGTQIRPDTLVVVEKVDDWAGRPDVGHSRLRGAGYLFVFADMGADQKRSELGRRRRRVTRKYTCQIGENGSAIDLGSVFEFRDL